MRINCIQIDSFRSIESADVQIPDYGIAVFGRNHTGKTSLRLAVQMALFGCCQHTGRDGRGASCLIRDGADQAQIVLGLTLADGQEVTCGAILNRKEKNEWFCYDAGGKKMAGITCPDDLWGHEGIPRSVAALSASLSGADMEQALAEHLLSEIDQTRLAEECGDRLEWLTEFARETHNGLDFDGLMAMGEDAYKRRTGAKKQLAEAETEEADLRAVAAPVLDGRKLRAEDAPDLRARLDKMVARERALRERLGAAKLLGDWTPEGIEESLDKARAALDQAEAAAHNTETAEALTDVAALARQVDELSHALAEAKVVDAQARKNLTAAQHADGVCPTCKRPYDAVDLAPFEKAAKDAATALKTAEKALAKPTADLESHRTEAQKRLDAERLLADNVTRAGRELADLEAVKAKIATVGNAQEIEAELETLSGDQDRIARLLEGVKKVVELEGAKARAAKLAEHVDALNWCCEAFRTGKVLNALVEDKLDHYCGLVNEQLTKFGFILQAKASGRKIEVFLKVPGEQMRPIALVSSGCALLAQWGMALAFAGETGSPVLLDDLNHLDAQYRKEFLRCLRDLNGKCTVMVAGAWQQGSIDMAAVSAALAPITLLWAEGGQITTHQKENEA